MPSFLSLFFWANKLVVELPSGLSLIGRQRKAVFTKRCIESAGRVGTHSHFNAQSRLCFAMYCFQTRLTSRASGGRGAQAGLYVFHTSAVCYSSSPGAAFSLPRCFQPICPISSTWILVVPWIYTCSNCTASLPQFETSRSIKDTCCFFVCFLDHLKKNSQAFRLHQHFFVCFSE